MTRAEVPKLTLNPELPAVLVCWTLQVFARLDTVHVVQVRLFTKKFVVQSRACQALYAGLTVALAALSVLLDPLSSACRLTEVTQSAAGVVLTQQLAWQLAALCSIPGCVIFLSWCDRRSRSWRCCGGRTSAGCPSWTPTSM